MSTGRSHGPKSHSLSTKQLETSWVRWAGSDTSIASQARYRVIAALRRILGSTIGVAELLLYQVADSQLGLRRITNERHTNKRLPSATRHPDFFFLRPLLLHRLVDH